ncbi:MAG: hypothetical protein LQ339_000754 [Xanthoria mediterranea]|nr:MAG: hypothetical protein LQ339_000754 [Xanthoria mediterranea]
MHFSTTCLALALSLTSSAIARPQQGQCQQQQATTTFNGGYQMPQPTDTIPSGGNNNVPRQCMMFMPYVPPALLGAVCSLHMTPLAAGSVPIVPTSCLSAGGSRMTIVDGDDDEDEYELPEQPQPTTTLGNFGYQRQQQANYEPTTTTSESTTTYGGNYAGSVPTPSTPSSGYSVNGSENDDDDE